MPRSRWILGFLQSGIFRRRAHRKLIHVGAPKKHHTGLTQATRDTCIVGRAIFFGEKLGATGARLALDVDVVLHRNRNTTEGQAEIGSVCGLANGIAIEREKGSDLLLAGGNFRKQIIENLGRFDLAFDEEGAQGGDGLLG